MENLMINHPFLSLLIILFIGFNLTALIALFTGVWKEGLRAKIKKQNKRIVNLMACISNMKEKFKNECDAWRELTRWHMKEIKELRASNDRHMIRRINQGIELEQLKDELKEARQSVNIMPYVEDMSNDYFTLIREKRELDNRYKLQYERVNELQKAFVEASTEIKNKTEYSKSVEKENITLKEMYATAAKENNQLLERVNKLTATVNHEKYIPLKDQKPVDSDWWTPKRNIEELFIEGIAYRMNDSVNVGINLLRLWSGNKSYTVQKADFIPCDNRAKHVLKHTGNTLKEEKVN